MNAPPNGYGGFYNHNPNVQWSYPSFNYKNNVGTQNPSSYPNQQFQGYSNPPQHQHQQPYLHLLNISR